MSVTGPNRRRLDRVTSRHVDAGVRRLSVQLRNLSPADAVDAELEGAGDAARRAGFRDVRDRLLLQGERLELAGRVLDRGRITTSAEQAGGGQIIIEVGRLIDLQKSSIVSSVGQAEGDAGDISIDPDFLVLDDSPLILQVEGRAKPKMPPKQDLPPEDIANCVLYVVEQPQRCDVVSVQIRPLKQLI